MHSLKPSTDPAHATDVITERRLLSGVPVLLFRNCHTTNGQLLILSHGFLGNKDGIADQLGAAQLAHLGYVVAAMDNRAHGDRSDGTLNVQQPISLLRLRTLIKESADDVSNVVDALLGELGPMRVAMAGVSMGGFVTWRALVLDPRITVAVPILASPYWEDIPEKVPFTLIEVAEAQAYAARHNPALLRERLGNQAILALLGGADPHLDSGKVAAFIGALRPAYAQYPERIGVQCYGGLGHEFHEDMRVATHVWLNTHLSESCSSPAVAAKPPAVALESCAPFAPIAVARTRSFIVPATPEEVFPLLCPKREEDWIPGWKAETLYAPSGTTSEDAVFRTTLPGAHSLVWVVSRYEPYSRVEFSCVSEGAVVMRLKLHLQVEGPATRVDFSRTFISIGDKGASILRSVTEEVFMSRTDELRDLLATRLTKGTRADS